MKNKVVIKITVIAVLIVITFICIYSFIIKNQNVFGSSKNKNIDNVTLIKNKIETLCDIASAEYDYKEIIANRQTWILGINPKSIIIMSKGDIKAACKLVDLKEQSGKYSVILSKPYIIDGGAEIVHEEPPKNGFFNNYELKDDKTLVDNTHQKVEDKVKSELFDNAENNTKAIILGMFSNLGIKEDDIDFKFV